MGLINNVIPFTLIVYGETRISSGLASILNATTPIFTLLIAHLSTANEKLSGGKLVGVTFGFCGVAMLIGPAAFSTAKGSSLLGETSCLLAAVSYAFAAIYGRRFFKLAPLTIATGQISATAPGPSRLRRRRVGSRSSRSHSSRPRSPTSSTFEFWPRPARPTYCS
jgi:drug/metabolite transporter (DMT)-like permease